MSSQKPAIAWGKEEAVKALEELLARAEAGTLKSAAIRIFKADESKARAAFQQMHKLVN